MATTTLGNKSTGSIIKLKENGTLVDFYVAKHDYESSLNGAGRTLVVRKDVYDQRQWHSSNVNAYASSTIDSWLNSTYKNLLDADIRSLIGTTKIRYTPGNGNGNWNVSTLERSVFLLSLTELGESHTYVDYTGASTGGGSQGTTQPSKPSEGTVGACVGDTVTFTGNKHYVSSNALNGSACKPGKAKVTAMAGNAKHPYHLIKVPGGGSTVYGWVDAADIQVEGGITVGSKVKVNKGAKTYTGGGLASFVYANTYTVIQVDGDRVVIGQNGVVTAAVNSKDLTLVG